MTRPPQLRKRNFMLLVNFLYAVCVICHVSPWFNFMLQVMVTFMFYLYAGHYAVYADLCSMAYHICTNTPG